MRTEMMSAEDFANNVLSDSTPGFHSDAQSPAMTTPMTPAAVQYVIQGSTICLIC